MPKAEPKAEPNAEPKTRPRAPAVKLDAVAAKAVDVARAGLLAEVPAEDIGEHLEVIADADRVVTHLFECLNGGYAGWRWAVTLNRALRAKTSTVAEIVLLPGPDALVAPRWVPWEERVQPGDLMVGTVWTTPADDERLTAGLSGADDLEGLANRSPIHPSQWEIGLGRERVLSPEGWLDAARRWHDGDFGPSSAMARATDLACATCGFLIVMGGPLGQAFGVCAQAMSPADGRVVALDYGCGAHSQVTEEVVTATVPAPVTDELNYDVLDLGHS